MIPMKLAVFVALLLVASSSFVDAQSAIGDSCSADYQCNRNNQICQVSVADDGYEQGICTCATGFRPSQLGDCVPNPQLGNSCSFDAECQQQQYCSMVEGNRCMCRTGFRMNGWGECEVVPVRDNRACWSSNDCGRNEICTVTTQTEMFRVCDCLPGFVRDRNRNECVRQWEAGFENRTCQFDNDCGDSQLCYPMFINDNEPSGLLCACKMQSVFDWRQQSCRPQRCEDWCYETHGDTCRWGTCRRCWSGDVFICNDLLPPADPPTFVFQRPASLLSVWIWSIFFVFVSLLLLSCLLKLCIGRRKPAVPRTQTPTQRAFVADQHSAASANMDTSSCIKMPLDTPLNAAGLYTDQRQQSVSGEQPPPPYSHGVPRP